MANDFEGQSIETTATGYLRTLTTGANLSENASLNRRKADAKAGIEATDENGKRKIEGMSEPSAAQTENAKTMTIIVTKGVAGLGLSALHPGHHRGRDGRRRHHVLHFLRLPLLRKKLDLQVTALGNAAMKMPLMGMHMAMPNIVDVIPGVDAGASRMMKNLIKKKGVASIEELARGGDRI